MRVSKAVFKPIVYFYRHFKENIFTPHKPMYYPGRSNVWYYWIQGLNQTIMVNKANKIKANFNRNCFYLNAYNLEIRVYINERSCCTKGICKILKLFVDFRNCFLLRCKLYTCSIDRTLGIISLQLSCFSSWKEKVATTLCYLSELTPSLRILEKRLLYLLSVKGKAIHC